MQPLNLSKRLVIVGALCCVTGVLTSVPLMTGCVPAGAVLPPDSTLQIDATLTPAVRSLEGLGGGPARPVGAVIEPDGTHYEFVANEIVLKPQGQEELNAFIVAYGAIVLRDGADSGGYYLLQIDPSRAPLNETDLTAYIFSSEEAGRTLAVALREAEDGADINELSQPQASLEGPEFIIDGVTYYWDAEKFLEFQEDSDPNKPGDQGYSVGIPQAWEYLGYLGIREVGTFFLPTIAIVDEGFALDETTGVPLNGNLDYGTLGAPLQKDFVSGDDFAGGPRPGELKFKWHGQSSFGVAAAFPKNLYGSAGTGGHFVRPMLLRSNTSDSDARAIRHAANNGASIISNSYTHNKRHDHVNSAIQFARSKGVVVLAAAGNGVKDPMTGAVTLQDTTQVDIYPCEYEGVICVGGIDLGLRNEFNFGDGVDIWSPNAVWTTPNPDTRLNSHGFVDLGVYSGTSAATPFVAGIVGLMIAADRDITEAQILSVLHSTANMNPADPLVARGWVDAFRAVTAVRPNAAPDVTITQPLDGQTIGWQAQPLFKCTYLDPEIDPTDVLRTNRYHGVVVFSSDIDGEMCRAETPPYNCTSMLKELSIGMHTITAQAIDPFEASSTVGIKLNVVNRPPVPEITKPVGTESLFSHIPVEFVAFVPDPDETITDAQIAWSSNLDGPLGTGGVLLTTLTAGTHTVTMTATDGKGLSASDQVVITVAAGAGFPTPVITSPVSGTLFGPGQSVTLEGTATDPENGMLSGASLEWSSDRDGLLGTGNSVSFTPSFVPSQTPGCAGGAQHIITLKATDSDNHVATVTIAVNVGCIF